MNTSCGPCLTSLPAQFNYAANSEQPQASSSHQELMRSHHCAETAARSHLGLCSSSSITSGGRSLTATCTLSSATAGAGAGTLTRTSARRGALLGSSGTSTAGKQVRHGLRGFEVTCTEDVCCKSLRLRSCGVAKHGCIAVQCYQSHQRIDATCSHFCAGDVWPMQTQTAGTVRQDALLS